MNNAKISILEKVSNMFVCSICCDAKHGIVSKPFNTSTASLFLEHQRCQHPSISDFECVYCCCRVPISNSIQHIQSHFNIIRDNRFHCQHCRTWIKEDIMSTISHVLIHNIVECPHCYFSFQSIKELIQHIKSNVLILYHCSFNDCLIKSHHKEGMLAHLKRNHHGSRVLRVEAQFLCSDRSIQKLKCNCLSDITKSPFSEQPQTPTQEENQLITLPYSSRVLNKLSCGLDERLREELLAKMNQYSQFRVRLEVVDGQKQFVCNTCHYRSVHSLADVRKHILGCHCSVSTSYTRLCLRASRLDTNNFSLFSDKKLISFANEKLKRADGTNGWETSGDTSTLQLLDDSEPESENMSETASKPMKRYSQSGGPIAKKMKTTQRQTYSSKMRSDSPIPEVGKPLERNETIERYIHLNYSWPVLESLVAKQCPEKYLPILRQKMDVYAQHSILLTRRNGKRYFLCSHCPNCSPHGMNDIRKHILGVHARLPERFKAMAMYCSRMNRDNYGLLSDEELLKKNQDLLRWKSSSPPPPNVEDHSMVPLLTLPHMPTDELMINTNGSVDLKVKNIFLSSGDNTDSSPNSLTIVTDSLSSQLASDYQQSSSQFSHFSSIFFNPNGIHLQNGNDLSDESSPKPDDNSSSGDVSNNKKIQSDGRSRRSLVLKSKAHNNNNATTIGLQSYTQ